MFRAYGHDEQIQRLTHAPQIRHTAHAGGIGFAVAQDDDPIFVESRTDDVFKDGTSEISPLGGHADDADAFGVQQVSDARHGPGRRFFFRQREFAHAVERDHQIVGEGERVDFQLVDDERRVRIVRREVVPHADEGLKAFDELVVGNDAALPARQSGEFSI